MGAAVTSRGPMTSQAGRRWGARCSGAHPRWGAAAAAADPTTPLAALDSALVVVAGPLVALAVLGGR